MSMFFCLFFAVKTAYLLRCTLMCTQAEFFNYNVVFHL